MATTMGNQLERLVGSLKSKLKGLMVKKPYNKIDKSESMRIEMRSNRAKKLIAETLKLADSPGNKSCAF